MTYKDVTQLPLWEHAAESGRFAEYMGIGSGLASWNVVGKGLISCLTVIGGVADVLHLGMWSSRTEADEQSIAAALDPAAAGVSPAVQQEGDSLDAESPL